MKSLRFALIVLAVASLIVIGFRTSADAQRSAPPARPGIGVPAGGPAYGGYRGGYSGHHYRSPGGHYGRGYYGRGYRGHYRPYWGGNRYYRPYWGYRHYWPYYGWYDDYYYGYYRPYYYSSYYNSYPYYGCYWPRCYLPFPFFIPPLSFFFSF